MATETPPQRSFSLNAPLPPEYHPEIDHIVTEDGAAVDNVFSEKQCRLLTEPLYSSWRPSSPFMAFSDVGLFSSPELPPLVPDVMLSVGISTPENPFPKKHRSYFIWQYNKPPDVVIEIVSNKEGNEDSSKLTAYSRLGVSYYAIFDPERHLSEHEVQFFVNVAQQFEPIKAGRLEMPRLGLSLAIWEGQFEELQWRWLRWYDDRGELIPTGAERAEQERLRAEQERSRAEAAEQKLADLRRRLREAGVDDTDV